MKLKSLDYLDISSHFTDDEIMVQHTARDFVTNEVMPDIEKHFEEGSFPLDMIQKFGDLGFLGMNLPEEYGCAGMSHIAYGLLCQELERGDSGVRSFVSVQGSLVMYPIYAYGSEEQRKRWLPKLASGENIPQHLVHLSSVAKVRLGRLLRNRTIVQNRDKRREMLEKTKPGIQKTLTRNR